MKYASLLETVHMIHTVKKVYSCSHTLNKIHHSYIIIYFNSHTVHSVMSTYVGHLESKERLRIQPAQLFNFS